MEVAVMRLNRLCFAVNQLYSIIENANFEVVGGAEIRIAKYVTALLKEGTIIDVITSIRNVPAFSLAGKSGIQYYNVKVYDRVPLVDFIRSTIKAFKATRAPVIYKRAYDPYLGLCGILARIFGKRLVFGLASDADTNFFRTIKFHGLGSGTLYYLGLFTCHRIILQSRTQLDIIAPMLRARSHIILKGSDDCLPDDAILGFSGRKFFLWVGRFAREKHPEHLLQVAKSGLPIRIAGRVDSAYSFLIKNLVAFPNVKYLGILDPISLRKQYSESFALLNTSDFEGFPETFLEAWLTGTPIISLNFAINEFEKDRGGICTRGSVDKLIDVMKQISTDRVFFESLSRSARDLIKHKYKFQKELERFKEILFAAWSTRKDPRIDKEQHG